jgi:hypothetical protein
MLLLRPILFLVLGDFGDGSIEVIYRDDFSGSAFE